MSATNSTADQPSEELRQVRKMSIRWRDHVAQMHGLRMPAQNVFRMANDAYVKIFVEEVRKATMSPIDTSNLSEDSRRGMLIGFWNDVLEDVYEIRGIQFFMEELVRLNYLPYRCFLPVDSYLGLNRRNWASCDVDPQRESSKIIKIFSTSKAIAIIQQEELKCIYINGIENNLYVSIDNVIEYALFPFYFSYTPIPRSASFRQNQSNPDMFAAYFSSLESIVPALYIPPVLVHSMFFKPHMITLKSGEGTQTNVVRNLSEQSIIDIRTNVPYLNSIVSNCHYAYVHLLDANPNLAAFFLLCLFARQLKIPYFHKGFKLLRRRILPPPVPRRMPSPSDTDDVD
jgi:hypothetical protein